MIKIIHSKPPRSELQGIGYQAIEGVNTRLERHAIIVPMSATRAEAARLFRKLADAIEAGGGESEQPLAGREINFSELSKEHQEEWLFVNTLAEQLEHPAPPTPPAWEKPGVLVPGFILEALKSAAPKKPIVELDSKMPKTHKEPIDPATGDTDSKLFDKLLSMRIEYSYGFESGPEGDASRAKLKAEYDALIEGVQFHDRPHFMKSIIYGGSGSMLRGYGKTREEVEQERAEVKSRLESGPRYQLIVHKVGEAEAEPEPPKLPIAPAFSLSCHPETWAAMPEEIKALFDTVNYEDYKFEMPS